MMGEDERISELMDRAKEIETGLFDDGFSPREVLFIATLISHSASRLMDKSPAEEEEEEYDGEEYAGEPGEVRPLEEEEYVAEEEPQGEQEEQPPEEPEEEEDPGDYARD